MRTGALVVRVWFAHEPSNGSWHGPIVLVKKNDDSTRFCIDFWQLNSVTRKGTHPCSVLDC